VAEPSGDAQVGTTVEPWKPWAVDYLGAEDIRRHYQQLAPQTAKSVLESKREADLNRC
jgi:hypothetical protein